MAAAHPWMHILPGPVLPASRGALGVLGGRRPGPMDPLLGRGGILGFGRYVGGLGFGDLAPLTVVSWAAPANTAGPALDEIVEHSGFPFLCFRGEPALRQAPFWDPGRRAQRGIIEIVTDRHRVALGLAQAKPRGALRLA